MVFDFINKFFSKNAVSKKIAKERLQLVLVHDRSSMSPKMFQALKTDLIAVISRYMEIDEDNLEVNLDCTDQTMSLVANIPVKQMRNMLN